MNEMNSAQEPTPNDGERSDVSVVEKLLNECTSEKGTWYQVTDIPKAASAIVEHYRKVMVEKDRTIQSLTDQLKNQKETNLHWYTKCADQQEEIRQLNLAIKLGDEKSAKEIASLGKALAAFIKFVIPYLPNDINNSIIATMLNTTSAEPLPEI